jgi:hypothetical protein
MRYWSRKSSPYQFRESKNIIEFLKDQFSNEIGFKRLVFRSHNLLERQITKHNLEDIFGKEIEIVFWEDLFPPNIDFPELAEPEAVFWNSSCSPKLFFGFDSSLCVLIGQAHPATKITWPSNKIYSNYFDQASSSILVDQNIELMQKIMDSDLKSNLNAPSFEIEGFAMKSSITKMLIENWNSRFTQERDALTQERDALTQERDALTQERDALLNSRIWKWTRALRIVKNFFKS